MHTQKILKLLFAGAAGLVLTVTLITVLARPVSADATILYAKPGGEVTGSCENWADACDMQYALTSAISGTEIWVAHGVYIPGLYMTSTFQLQSGVALYGGFAMTETVREQRNWLVNLTVLSGDIDGNDTTDPNGVVTDTNNIHGNNAYHVLDGSGADTTAILDGFIATAGKATGGSNYSDGGGMYISSSGSPTVQNISFIGNHANGFGGGLYNEGNPALSHVVFRKNKANQSGGGLYTLGEPLITDVDFIGNQADAGGGLGIAGSDNKVTIDQARFIGNRAFWPGSYTWGGGMYVNQGEGSSLNLMNAIFSGNTSTWYGGGMLIAVGDVHLTNVLFYGNWAGDSGGGMWIYQTAPDMTNVTFSGNWSNYGGGIYLNALNSFPLNLVNSILWGNTASYGSQIYIESGQVNATYSDIRGGYAGEGNIDADPMFTAPITATVAPTTTGDYHLQITSPAIDAGDNQAISVTTDLDGNPRKSDIASVPDTGYGTPPIVDMGPYEVTWPIADAGSDQTVKSGVLVTLDGSASSDPGGHLPLTYGWAQTGGIPVVLSSDVISQPTFTAPDVTEQTILTITLAVTNSIGQVSPPDGVNVTVVPILADLGLSLTDNTDIAV
jgi:predicted outer membrane repeat protein